MTEPVARSVVVPNRYRDSVALMRIAASVTGIDGLVRASVLMATEANLADAGEKGFAVDPGTFGKVPTANDVFVGLIGTEAACEEALSSVEGQLRSGSPTGNGGGSSTGGAVELPRSLQAAARWAANDGDPAGAEHGSATSIAMVSVPGAFAASEARKALQLGMHVMLFSDNVALDDEAELKRTAGERGLLLMGPDCGTAMIDGVPLGFVNAVRRGPIAVIGASGTGMQEVMARVHQLGSGISQAIGCGGRDLREAINAATMCQALRMVDHGGTEVVVLISKPPHPSVLKTVVAATRSLVDRGTPVILAFTGLDPAAVAGSGLIVAPSLADAARLAVENVRGHSDGGPAGPHPPSDGPDRPDRPDPLHRLPKDFPKERTAIVGAFVGGTLCTEFRFLLERVPPGLTVRCVDFGDDDYTRGRPHPMIDPELRDADVLKALHDPTVALVHFDVVLGFGASGDPIGPLLSGLAEFQREARTGPVLSAHVLGTDLDSQGRPGIVERLRAVGVHVSDTNAEAAVLANSVADQLVVRGAA